MVVVVAAAGGDLGFCFYLGLGYVGTQEFFGFGFGFGFFGLTSLAFGLNSFVPHWKDVFPLFTL